VLRSKYRCPFPFLEGETPQIDSNKFKFAKTIFISELSGNIGFGYVNGEYQKIILDDILSKNAVLDISFRPTTFRSANITTSTLEQSEEMPVINTGDILGYTEFKHTQKGFMVNVVTVNKRLEDSEYRKLNVIAKKNGGYYSSYNKGGAIAGFHFKTKESALKTIEEYNDN
jgi:hypothetical protein